MMADIIVAGVDPSLSATGIARSDIDEPFLLKPPKSVGLGVRRLLWFHEELVRSLAGVSLVVIEGYAYGATNVAHKLGELGGVLRLVVAQGNMPHILIPPARVKMLACGKGNANKLEVFSAAKDRLGYLGSNDNESDSMWVLQAGLHAVRHPVRVSLPKTHIRAIANLKIVRD